MVDLLGALDFGCLVGKALSDGKCEVKPSAFVHSLVRLDRKSEVEGIVGVREVGLHGTWEGELREICERGVSREWGRQGRTAPTTGSHLFVLEVARR